MTVNILGTEYKIIVKNYDEEEAFSKNSYSGFCNGYKKEIVLCDMHTFKGWENEDEETIVNCHKQDLRHEIVHAFFYESGLWDNSCCGGAWAKNEEMVDWIALQGEKIYEAWKSCDAIS
ncbi:MAG: hypothetical protein IJ366_00555 [Clostridia bacterium]|nr:hypothetical protein [Clostridia bacterium]MBQ7792988.1 hypothetical protein [Clostridia bacterium]